MPLALDATETILLDGAPVIFPKDASGAPAPMLSGIGSDGQVHVVSVTPEGALAVEASITATLGEVEIKNDAGNPVPTLLASTQFDALMAGITGIRLEVDSIDVNTDQVEGKLDVLAAKLDAMAVLPGISGSTHAYFMDEAGTALTQAFQELPFGFTSFSISLTNDGAVTDGYIEYSFDGVNVHGRINNGEGFANDFRAQAHIYLRGQNGGEKYRLGAY